ncbi:APC family permease [Mycolicibacterium sp. P9-22]|uniref:APC family permease n=1 Tax=Mycolicibacterium sp. P9-22 TaxID=2024613 RepID=UPI0011F00709|nr:APC family permease [Mycolicibacterium sp. P9-22]KAA0109035.1 APC family permease [Mycolicibacterium sp. P9-22]
MPEIAPITNSSDGATAEATTTTSTLQGNLGVASIFFSVVAWAAPLLVVVGLMPSMIAFSGNGIVAGFATTTSILLLFSVGYTAITRYVDRPGAFYTYITAGLGREAGLGGAFVAIFGYLLLLLSTWVALGFFLRQLVVDTLGGPDIPWYVLSVAGSLIAGLMSYLTIEFSAKTLTFALLLEVVLVVVFNAVVFKDGGSDGVVTQPFTAEGIASGSFGLAVLYAALCFIGFESSAIYREEAKDPVKTIPRATYLAVSLIGIFYMISAWALLTALGPQGVADAQAGGDVSTMFNDLSSSFIAAVVPDIVTVLVITSTFACLLASHNAVARYGYSLGRDGVLPKRFGQAHPKFKSPYLASILITVLELVAISVIATVTKFAGDGSDAFTIYVRMNGLGAIAVVFLMSLVSIAVIVYFRTHGTAHSDNRWKTLIAPSLGLIGLIGILVLALQNVDVLIGASLTVSLLMTLVLPLVLAGGFLYARWLRQAKADVYTRIGRQG